MIVAAKKLTATMGLRFFVAVAIISATCLNSIYADDQVKHLHYVNEWAATIPGGIETAREIVSSYGYTLVDQILPDIYLLRHSRVSKRSKYPSKYYHKSLAQDKHVIWLEQQVAKKRVKRFIQYQEFNDSKWRNQWYLNRGDGLDMNVQKAWAMGVTGKGVAVTILDDGIEREHPDLKKNFDEKASYDVNGHDPDPTPRYDYKNENRHGTRCAGEVAAQANNSECIVGAAYDARIGGVRMLDGDVTDSVEAQSLGLNPQHIQIYSASWGPDDDGRTVDGPATLARKAFYDGVTRGRGGLGSIFVWASGNGGRDDDSCNCDGYTNSIHTLSISSATENGKIPWYSEACSSTLATTYSSGSAGERQIMTTDIKKGCTETHTGTSASAPIAAGLCALALQANPMLTWRDMQHIVVMTAKPDYLQDPTWTTNGVSRKVSHSFGYGLMDAAAMVQLARNWTTVPPQHICEIRSFDTNKPVPMNGKISVPLYTDGCEGTEYEVKYLEHVQARITLKASRRGDIQIYLTSPMGTRSTLLAKRSQDNSKEGFNNWAFMTTHNWGELAKGQWVLVIENGARSSELTEWKLVLMGTKTHPQAYNVTPPVNSDQPFTCSGITSNGVCIECRPGYYKLKDGCVANCPEHYYGMMQMVRLRSTENTSINNSKYQRQGVCNPCHEACRTCKGPRESECFQCTDGYEKQEGHCQKKLLLNFLDPDMLGFFIWVIVLCIAAIVLFGVIFGLLHARDRRMLCWKGSKLDANKCEYNGINLTQEDLDNDLHNFDIIRNRNFRHASIPESQDPLCTVRVNQLENEIHLKDLTESYKLDRSTSRNNPVRNSGGSSLSDSVQDRNSLSSDNYSKKHHSDHRKNRMSDRSSGRKYMESYVSYDINSTLTQTIGKDLPKNDSVQLAASGSPNDVNYKASSGKDMSRNASLPAGLMGIPGHPSFHTARSVNSLRH
ncbi:furin-like protease kpc-1 isoform X3 [Dreissena polymorpha]|uniref:furin-like protease kpc-1 isoform X3 n=1 Tax=Dreissena polymorpha TaxID=45954 RepID=UPI002264B9BB|nr:furin-like protease kpc-1 isoform X3 [Dreissena polymorpha]